MKMKSNFVSYEQCKEWAMKNGIKSVGDYTKAKRPPEIPYAPHQVYKSQGWTDWKSFLGTSFPSYEVSKAVVQSMGIKTSKDFPKSVREKNIPLCPQKTYKEKGWVDWSDYLGTKNTHTKKFVSLEECQKWAKKNKIKTSKEYQKSRDSSNMPARPDIVYKDKGWISWKDFLRKTDKPDNK